MAIIESNEGIGVQVRGQYGHLLEEEGGLDREPWQRESRVPPRSAEIDYRQQEVDGVGVGREGLAWRIETRLTHFYACVGRLTSWLSVVAADNGLIWICNSVRKWSRSTWQVLVKADGRLTFAFLSRR